MGMDADVHARTRTDADVLWDLSEWTRTHVNERTQALGGRTGEKNTRYVAGYIQCLGSQKNANAAIRGNCGKIFQTRPASG